jgi:hypothetical protein
MKGLGWVFFGVMAIHALIHLMGFAKAFGFAELSELQLAISRGRGAVWLVAAILLVATLGSILAEWRWWWILGALALVVSQLLIFSAWQAARFGTGANVVLLGAVLYGFLTLGPLSFRQQFETALLAGRARVELAPAQALLTEVDLAPLPVPVQRYLRVTGFVGQPKTRSYRLRFSGRIRGGPTEPWMEFTAQQQSFAEEPTRLFLMSATMRGLPVQALHQFREHASFRVKVAGVATIIDAEGPELDKSETVTVFNDMCLLAPGTLIDPRIRWESIDERSVRAHFTHRGLTISATLMFDAEGFLSDFVSDDRSRSSPDGKTFTPLRFSTPVRDYRQFGPVRLGSFGEARWHAPVPEGEFVYGEFRLLDIDFNVL